ncbi:isoprenylcysteine carboxylmethyltransferase family protein [Pontiellaceae bacterium B12227]|nr:isoprenylcysteine carboxylmethyltransferase family protein [Pontiellaceae bacterium B12227]
MKKILPPTYLLATIVIMTVLHFLLPLRNPISFPWRLLALAPLAAGIILNLLADRAFRIHGTSVKPFERSSTLVTAGVFRISRHPMYLGMLLMVTGIAVLLGSASPWGGVILLAVVFDRHFIKTEEQMLEETFGDLFREYRKHVRKWI